MITVEKVNVKIMINEEYYKAQMFISLFNNLKDLVNNKKEIPLEQLKELLNGMEFEDPGVELRNQKDNLIEKCYDYLVKTHHDFSVKATQEYTPWLPTTATYIPKFELKDFVKHGFDTILKIPTFEWMTLNKSKIIKIIHKSLTDYNKYLSEPRKPYSLYVITGSIVSQLGFIDSYKTYSAHRSGQKTGYNQFLKDEVRNGLNAK